MTMGRALQAAGVVSLWCLGDALPANGPLAGQLLARQDECPTLAFDANEDDRRHIWDSSNGGLGTGQFLDDWIQKHGSGNWSTRFDQDLHLDGGESFLQCNDLDGTCEAPPKCTKFDDAQTYWVETAVLNHHDAMSGLAEYLKTQAFLDVFDVDDFIDKFGDEPDEDLNILALLSSCLVIASGPAGFAGETASKVLGGLFAGMIGATGFAGQFVDEKKIDQSRAVRDRLKATFEAMYDLYKNLVSLASAGEPWSSTASMTVNDLPGDGPWASPIAAYFDGGRWLLPVTDWHIYQNMHKSLSTWKLNIKYQLKQAMVMALLRKNKYFAFIQTWHDENSCKDSDDEGLLWIDGEGCVDFWKASDVSPRAEGGHSEQLKAMQSEDFGKFDLKTLYTEAIKCARANPDGKGKVEWGHLHGANQGPPSCFFNLPVFRGHKNDRHMDSYGYNLFANDDDQKDYINTLEGTFGWTSGDKH